MNQYNRDYTFGTKKSDAIAIIFIVAALGYFVVRSLIGGTNAVVVTGLEPDPGVEFGQNEPLDMNAYFEAVNTGALREQ